MIYQLYKRYHIRRCHIMDHFHHPYYIFNYTIDSFMDIARRHPKVKYNSGLFADNY